MVMITIADIRKSIDLILLNTSLILVQLLSTGKNRIGEA